MKVRDGFVSNSSSSSFVILTTKANHQRALKRFHPAFRSVISQVVEANRCFGMDMISYYELDCHGESSLDGRAEMPEAGTPLDCLSASIEAGEDFEPLSEDEQEKFEGLQDLMDAYCAAIQEQKDQCFTHTEEM